MKRVGLVAVSLAVGCFTGVAVRELVVLPAHAAAGAPSYDYEIVDSEDLIATVKQRNPSFGKVDDRAALQEGIAGFGRGGWRYAGCLQSAAYSSHLNDKYFICNQLIFEQGGAGGPPAVSTAMAPPPDVINPPSHMPR